MIPCVGIDTTRQPPLHVYLEYSKSEIATVSKRMSDAGYVFIVNADSDTLNKCWNYESEYKETIFNKLITMWNNLVDCIANHFKYHRS